MWALEPARVRCGGVDQELGLELLPAVRADNRLKRLGDNLGHAAKLAKSRWADDSLPGRVEVVEAPPGGRGDLFGKGGAAFVEGRAVCIDLDETPAVARGREANHQQRLEPELLEEGRFVRLR